MSKPLILMYHRIADEPVDYWGLAVSPAHFEEHLSVIRRTRHPFPLLKFVERLIAGTLPPDAVALTFDDGYVDNLESGLPRLVAADVPATVFLATGFLDRPDPFWWDELAALTLCDQAPKSFTIEIGQQVLGFKVDPASVDDEGAGPSERRPVGTRAVLEALYEPLRQLDDDERRTTMTKLRANLSTHDDLIDVGRAMRSDEVRKLTASGLVMIGAHTVTHPSLPRLDPAACRREVAASKAACEAFAAAPVTAFAYPFGEFDSKAREAVKDAGFAMACSTRRMPVGATSDLFAMPRIWVPDQDGDAFDQRLRWASELGEG
jgi:peptidoglycan/xylan/chitin deacetylase (PgdA/CDA1 family)